MRSATPGRPAPIRLLQLNAFVSILDRFAMPPLLIAIAADLDAPLTAVVQAAGAYFLAYGLSQPLWGVVSDSLGLVRTMRLALVVRGSRRPGGRVRRHAAGARDRAGRGRCLLRGRVSGRDHLHRRHGPSDRRQRELTRLMVGVALGTALASVGAGVVAQLFTWRAVFVATASPHCSSPSRCAISSNRRGPGPTAPC